jgi:hypothetical protein
MCDTFARERFPVTVAETRNGDDPRATSRCCVTAALRRGHAQPADGGGFADAQDQDSLSLSRPWHNTLSGWTLAEVSPSDKGVQGEGDPKCHAEAVSNSSRPVTRKADPNPDGAHGKANRKRPNHPAAMIGQEGGGERNNEVTTEDGARAGLGQPAERIQTPNDCEDPRDQPGCHQDAPQSLSSLRARPAASPGGPGLPPHRFLHLEGDRARHIMFHRQLGVLSRRLVLRRSRAARLGGARFDAQHVDTDHASPVSVELQAVDDRLADGAGDLSCRGQG